MPTFLSAFFLSIRTSCHHAFVFQKVEAVEEEGEVGGGLGGEAVAFKSHVVGQRVGGFPAVTEGRVGDDGVEAGFLRRVRLPHHVPLVEQGVAVEDVELRVLHPVQQHVHATTSLAVSESPDQTCPGATLIHAPYHYTR